MTYSHFPAYTEDITVAGSLLVDRLGGFYEKVRGVDPLSPVDIAKYPALQLKVNNVQLLDRFGEARLSGTIHVTTSHIIFKADESAREIWVLNHLIGSVDRGTATALGCPLNIRCKHFQQLTFLIARDRDCQILYENLLKSTKLVNIGDVFAFTNREQTRGGKAVIGPGWTRFNAHDEFTRQGVDESWHCTDLNHDYSVCDTYPQDLWVPRACTVPMLIASSRFRSRGRLPVLSFWYRVTGAVIARCAQPLTGFSARCVEDEQLMEQIARANPTCNTLFLVDTRPRVNAMVNKVQGKGFEDVRNYANMRFHFFDIENIHVMRASLNKLLEACHRSRTVSEYYRMMEASGWLRHSRALLECAAFMADSLIRGISCVVHCSDGWDRTSQTVALTQILLDPFYRTIGGFQVLIEKDWLAMGHKFDDRCGHVGALNDESAKEISPVFTQFLDVVWQIHRQRTRAFQFNERYLIEINEHAYSCQYGTFLGNCDKDRKDLKLAKSTQSLWDYFDARQDDYLNPLYEPGAFSVLVDLDLRAPAITVWHGLYNRFESGLLSRESIAETAIVSLEHIGVLEARLATLQTRIAELRMSLNSGTQSSTPVMDDSGHSSQNGAGTNVPMEAKTTTESNWNRQDTLHESGVYDSSIASSDEMTPPWSVQWQSLRGADECASASCGAEFACRFDRRLHCYRCGKVFCRRCVHTSSDGRERICERCASAG